MKAELWPRMVNTCFEAGQRLRSNLISDYLSEHARLLGQLLARRSVAAIVGRRVTVWQVSTLGLSVFVADGNRSRKPTFGETWLGTFFDLLNHS